MRAEATERAAAVVELLRDRYVSSGYQFFSEPSGSLLPSFLGRYRPDAIAVGPDGRKIVIEIKVQEDPRLGERWKHLQDLIRDKPGWELRIVRASDMPSDETVEPSPLEALADVGERARALAADGHAAAALLLGWSALEGIVRHRANAPRSRALRNPVSLVEWLTREGPLTDESSHALLELAALRNAVAHGNPSAPVAAGDLEPLFMAISDLAHEPTEDSPTGPKR